MTKVSVKHEQSAIGAMYTGLALTVVSLISPTSTTHRQRAGRQSALAIPRTAGADRHRRHHHLVYVSIIGALGVISWLWTIRTVNAGKRWAHGAATAMSRSEQASPCSISSSKTPPATPACHRCWAGSACCHAWPGF